MIYKFLPILFIVCFINKILAQNGTTENISKYNKNNSKSDSLVLLQQRPFIAKIDTVYYKSLDLVKEEKTNIKDWLGLIGVLVGSVIGMIGQFLLKKKEMQIYRVNQRENNRVKNLEDIYLAANSLSLFDYSTIPQLLPAIQSLERLVSDKALYTSKEQDLLVQEICDYYKEVANDYSNKNILTETNFTHRFKISFNR